MVAIVAVILVIIISDQIELAYIADFCADRSSKAISSRIIDSVARDYILAVAIPPLARKRQPNTKPFRQRRADRAFRRQSIVIAVTDFEISLELIARLACDD